MNVPIKPREGSLESCKWWDTSNELKISCLFSNCNELEIIEYINSDFLGAYMTWNIHLPIGWWDDYMESVKQTIFISYHTGRVHNLLWGTQKLSKEHVTSYIYICLKQDGNAIMLLCSDRHLLNSRDIFNIMSLWRQWTFWLWKPFEFARNHKVGHVLDWHLWSHI